MEKYHITAINVVDTLRYFSDMIKYLDIHLSKGLFVWGKVIPAK